MYILIDQLLHFFQIFLLIRILNQDFFAWFSFILGAFVIDLDHLPLIKKIGFKKFLYLRRKVEAKKPRKYKLHNIASILFSMAGSILILSNWGFYPGIFFLSIFIHLVIDIIYSLIFFHTIEHWLL